MEKFDLVLKSARVVDAASGFDAHADVAIAGGKIAAVEQEISVRGRTRLVDARGLALLPGLIDMHVHMFQEGRSSSFAHRALASAGVTTAVEMSDMLGVIDQWHASAAGITVLGLEAIPSLDDRAGDKLATDLVRRAIRQGALGVKIFGGHFPNTPVVTAAVIAAASRENAYVAFHAGTNRHNSDLNGMTEAVELANGLPLHLAHTNAYLRGSVTAPLEENAAALELLRYHRNVVSEAHLAQLNICHGRLKDGHVEDQITVNCLKLRGYPPTGQGIRDAIADGYALVNQYDDSTVAHIRGEQAIRIWEQESGHVMLSFPVNLHVSAYLQTCARTNGDGPVAFQGDGEWVVDAISSDGGLWRNVILENGLKLVDLGALSLSQFVEKTSLRPAHLLGLRSKGAISPGMDADLVLVDLGRREAVMTVARGQVIFESGRAVGTGGIVLTHEAGVHRLHELGIPCQALDLEASGFRASHGEGTGLNGTEAMIGTPFQKVRK